MDPLQAGITAARQGHRADARAWLQEAIRRDSNSEPAWLWLSTVVETDAEYRLCLTRALAINPNNETTRARLADLAPAGAPAPVVPIEPLALTPVPAAEPPVSDIARVAPPAVATTPPPVAEPRQVRRLPPHLVTPEPTPPIPDIDAPEAEPSARRTALPALAVMGCLAVTAVSGLLVLLGLLVMGWAS
jgi:hypothetical protein